MNGSLSESTFSSFYNLFTKISKFEYIGSLLKNTMFLFQNRSFEILNPLLVFISVLFIPLFTSSGDLFASFIKRLQGKKDFGSIIPGHGGILDRIDGHLGALPLLAILFL